MLIVMFMICRNHVANAVKSVQICRKDVAKTMSRTTRKATRYIGVQVRESTNRKHNGRADVCFTIDYIDSATKKRIRKDIGWGSEGFTAAYASQVRADLIKKSQHMLTNKAEYKPTITITLTDAFERYVTEWLEPRGKSAKNDRYMFKNLDNYAHLPLSEFSNVYLLDKIVSELSSTHLSVRSVRYVFGLIQRVMIKMEAWGLYQGTMAFKKITLPKLNNARERFLTPNEVNILLSELQKRSITVYTQALLSLHCGLRFGEIAALKITDIDFYSMSIFIRDPKSGKSRHQVMTESIAEALKTVLAQKINSELIFPNMDGDIQKAVSRTFERVVKEIGLNSRNGIIITDARQKVVFHTLRHTYASWLASSGQGQAMIADLLGHSSIEMSARYTHLFPDERRATATAIEKIYKSSHE